MDLSIYETFDGGDVVLKGGDLELTSSIFNQPYLAMFSAIENTTEGLSDQLERFDWWGNELLIQDPKQQFNSEVEKALTDIALTSSGVNRLATLANKDVDYIKEVAEVSVSVSIIGHNKIRIKTELQQPENSEGKSFDFIWEATKAEPIDQI